MISFPSELIKRLNINSFKRTAFVNKMIPLIGTGTLAGSFPFSMLTNVGNLPSQAEIRVLYRPNTGDPGDGILVGTTTCNADGTWQVSGLDENLKYDIVARIPGYNDVIISDVQPASSAPLSAHFANLKGEYKYQEEVEIQVVTMGGVPPYAYQVVTLPVGLSFNPDTKHITGTIPVSLELIFELLVSDSKGTQFPLKGISYMNGDLHWDNVVGLYRPVDGVIRDISTLSNPMLYNTGLNIDAFEHFSDLPIMRLNGNTKAAFSMPPLGEDDFTIEMFHRADATHSRWPRVWSTLDQIALSGNEIAMQISSHTGSPSNALIAWVGNTLPRLPTPAGTGATGALNHVALCRRGEQVYLAYNGQIVSQTENPVFNDTNPTFVFGQGNSSLVTQWFTEVRITKGVARYTENFTPPTEPFLNF